MFFIITFAIILIFIRIFLQLTLGRCRSPACLVGKTALITGGNSGMGFETAMALAARGCRVIIADKDDCTKSIAKIMAQTGNNNIIAKKFTLASLASIRELAKNLNETEERLDILINNAGVSGIGSAYTADGIHMGMQINHYGPFLLTHLLIGLLKKSAPSRIIFVSSAAAYSIWSRTLIFPKDVSLNVFSEWSTYSNSKLCNIITANVLAKQLKGTGITVNSLHPGMVHTPIVTNYFKYVTSYKWQEQLLSVIYHSFIKPFLKTAEEGAQTAIYLAVAKEVENVTGSFFIDCHRVVLPPFAYQSNYKKKMWKTSVELVKLQPDEMLPVNSF